MQSNQHNSKSYKPIATALIQLCFFSSAACIDAAVASHPNDRHACCALQAHSTTGAASCSVCNLSLALPTQAILTPQQANTELSHAAAPKLRQVLSRLRQRPAWSAAVPKAYSRHMEGWGLEDTRQPARVASLVPNTGGAAAAFIELVLASSSQHRETQLCLLDTSTVLPGVSCWLCRAVCAVLHPSLPSLTQLLQVLLYAI
jgi:hypothetical protein